MTAESVSSSSPYQQMEWGTRKILEEQPHLIIYELRIKPHGHINQHRHRDSAESLFINDGEVLVCVGSYCKTLGKGETIFIPMDINHSIRNAGMGAATLIEVRQRPQKRDSSTPS